jgi:hypothetical protein
MSAQLSEPGLPTNNAAIRRFFARFSASGAAALRRASDSKSGRMLRQSNARDWKSPLERARGAPTTDSSIPHLQLVLAEEEPNRAH